MIELPRPTLVLTAHGSRDVRFEATARRIAAATAAALRGVRVELGFLDLNAPLVDEALAGLSGRVTVLPLLFGDGYHSKIDLPAMLAAARAVDPGLRVTQTPIVGRYSPVPALTDRLTEAGFVADGRTGVLLYAVGSSDPGSDASVRERGAELAGALGVPVRTVFATRLGSDGAAVTAAVDELRAEGVSRIAASPLFLSAGLLTERVERVLDRCAPGSLVAGPIGAHPSLIAAVSRLYHASLPALV